MNIRTILMEIFYYWYLQSYIDVSITICHRQKKFEYILFKTYCGERCPQFL